MKAWEHFLQQQERELGPETINKWLRSLKLVRFDACNLYLEAKDSFHVLWFEEHMRSKVQTLLINGNHHKIKVHLSVAHGRALVPNKRTKFNRSKEQQTPSFLLHFDELDPHCRFESFTVSQENHVTHQFLKDLLTQCPSSLGSVNPIYLYGPTGCGKTHLLMGLTLAFREKGFRATYVRAEHFTDHVVSAIRAGRMSIFRQAYRNTDILLIDDVQVFSRKGATQEEFFHTFNTLHLAGKQIILSANCSPQELQLIEQRLVSRFEWGIVLPLKTLVTDKRLEMLQAKSLSMQFPLSSKVIEFLLENFSRTPKTLIKAFEALALRLHADDQMASQNVSVQAVKFLLTDLLNDEQKSTLTPGKIVQSVAEHYGIRTEDIFGRSQTRECALPRQIAMHFCRTRLKMPFKQIGDLFTRDHSTVMTSVKFIQKSLDEDARDIAAAWHTIAKKLDT